ncbi:Uncharacterised protein [Mycobacteroides abscessus subsp. abscessus]|nr:Uncharacterised protein [Mycobacteroides abscessus subsp. abscessus]
MPSTCCQITSASPSVDANDTSTEPMTISDATRPRNRSRTTVKITVRQPIMISFSSRSSITRISPISAAGPAISITLPCSRVPLRAYFISRARSRTRWMPSSP